MALFTVTNSSGNPKAFNGWITSITESHDGNIYVFGNFTEYDNVSAGFIIKISLNGVIQESFDYGTGFGGNYAFEYTGLVLEPVTNDIIVTGYFSSYNGTSANNIVKLNSDGTIDATFNYGTGFADYALKGAIYNGSFYVGGRFSTYNGATATRIAKLDVTTGALDATFETNVPNLLTGSNVTIETEPDGLGNLYIHGYFADRLIKVDATTGIQDLGFDIGAGPNIADNLNPMDLSFDSDGRLLMSGYFTAWNGISHGRMVKLNTNGSIYNTFDLGTGFNDTVHYASYNSSDELLVLGSFTEFNGTPLTSGAVILNADGTLKEQIIVPIGFNFETPARVGSYWYVSANNYTSGTYYIVRIDNNGDKIFIT